MRSKISGLLGTPQQLSGAGKVMGCRPSNVLGQRSLLIPGPKGADLCPFRVSLVPLGVRLVPFCAQNVLFCAVLCTRRAPGRPSVASAGPRRACSRSLTPCPSRG